MHAYHRESPSPLIWSDNYTPTTQQYLVDCRETVFQGEVVSTGSHGGIPEGDVGRGLWGEEDPANILRIELVVDDLM